MSTSKARTRTRSSQAFNGARDELRNYKLYERIGQGELATIYRATHLGLDRPVHVAILRRTDWISVSRFQLAARLAARLNHPNLLPVIDAGHDDHYGDYLVTPMLAAQTLEERLQDGPLDPLLALRITTQIGAVLDFLHTNEVIHRDVQPANILVTPQGVAYLSNLSLAASPDAPDLSSVDEADYLTPYSAPEQCLDQSSASPALDVYGLGAVLYHMLSGTIPPVPGAVPPLLADQDPELAGVDRVLQRMLAEEPAARFPTLNAAVVVLRQALRSQIDLATDDMEESRWEPTAEWLENPLETVLSTMLDQEYLGRSRKRADDLHRANAIRRLLNRWSRRGRFRRAALGQLVQPEQIASYNIYFYELRTLYETRTPPRPRVQAQQGHERSATLPVPSLWDAPVPDMPSVTEFAEASPREVLLENSLHVYTCTECGGVSQVVCARCSGTGTVDQPRRVRNPDNSFSEEPLTAQCPECRGYGRQTCPSCLGSGSLVEEQFFTWSRHARLWQNTDDVEDLPRLPLLRKVELVYDGPINPFEGHWHSVAPLAELLRSAVAYMDDDSHLVAAELSIRGVPVTEVDYQFNEASHLLYIIGFDNEIIGDVWVLLNLERLALAAVTVVLVALALIALVLAVTG